VSKTAKKHIITFCNDIEKYCTDGLTDMPLSARLANARVIARAITLMIEVPERLRS
jgi:hypothetical protein